MWQKGSPAEIPMVTISCDVCGKQRTTGAGDWILGFDVPASSAPMGRSIKFLERWEEHPMVVLIREGKGQQTVRIATG